MTLPREPLGELTAKQRLVLSRQALFQAAAEPLWAGLLRAGIRRYLKLQGLKRDQVR